MFQTKVVWFEERQIMVKSIFELIFQNYIKIIAIFLNRIL